MSIVAVNQKPVFFATVRSWIARHPGRAYLIMAFVFAWTTMLPLLLSKQGFGLLPIELPIPFFNSLASFIGLALPAFVVAAAVEGKEGLYALLRRCLRWQVGVHWYLIALFGIFVATLLVVLPWVGWTPLPLLAQKWTLFFTAFLPGTLLPFLQINLPEEVGWTGLLQAKWQEKFGPVRASLMVAPFFTLMHLPAYFVPGWISDERLLLPEIIVTVGITMIFALFFRLVIMWLYNGSGGSLLIVGLFHSAFNVYSGQAIIPEFVDGLEEWSNPAVLAAVVLSAVALTLATRGRLAYKPS